MAAVMSLNLAFHQLRGEAEAHRVFGQQTGLAVDADVVAVVLDL